MRKLTKPVSVILSILMLVSMVASLNISAFAAENGNTVTAGQLTVRANSNIFPTVTQDFESDTNQLTVTWWMQVPDNSMINTQCVITYDDSKLSVDMSDGVNGSIVDGKRVDQILRVSDGKGTVTNYAPQQTYLEKHENHPDSVPFLEGEENNNASIKLNSVDLEGYDLTDGEGRVPFVSVTFNPKENAQGVTNVNLYVEIMQIAANGEEEHYFVARSEIADKNVSYLPETSAGIYEGKFDNNYPVAAGDVYTIAGTENFLGTSWTAAPDTNVMTLGSDGIYKITVPSVKAVDGAVYQLKVVQFYSGNPEWVEWHGEPGTGNNIGFSLKSDCDVTVTYNPGTGEIKVTGTGVTDPNNKISYVTAAGVGNGNFLNGVSWDPAEESNKLTEVSSGVYEITYNSVKANTDLKFKFTANGAWVQNWGYTGDVTFGTPTEAHFDGADIVVNYKSQNTLFDITLRLDLTKWDADKKTGATFTVTAKDIAQPTTAAPTTAAPTTKPVPTTVAPTTAAPTTKPAGDVYTLAGTSNFIDTAWEPTPDDYVMTKGSDGIYKITVPSVKAVSGAVYQVKVVQFVGGDPENMIWHGKDGGDGNVDFGLSKDCDVTVTYDPTTKAITVTGAGVTEPSYKIDFVTAVGVANGNFLNGVSWDPAEESNKLTEVSAGVYEITYNSVKANTDLKFKFTANGGWVQNWGYNSDVTFGTPTEAHFDGSDIVVNYKSQNTLFDITLRLDLTKWDAEKRNGATFTVIAKEIEQPTTEKPEPTTAAPTTAPVTTKPEPTTVAPTTKPAGDDIYTLAGTSNFIDTAWEPTPDDYVMTKGSDGIYKITVPSVTAIDGDIYQVKVVQFVGGDPENMIWHGKDGGDGNVDFGLSKDSDVTVTYNPATGEIKVTGAGVTEPSYALDYVTAAGSGYGNFLNGVSWDPTEESNRLTMVSPNVYEITYEEVDANTDLQFKFAANGGWVLNWGYTGDVAFDTPTEAHYDGGNIVVNYESLNDYFDLTIRLDLTNWDAEKRNGATFTVIAKEIEQPTTEKPEPTTVVPTTAQPTTAAPTTKPVPTTAAPTTAAPTTAAPTTKPVPTTVAPTTAAPTTVPPTTEPPVLYGDVNQDGKITIADATEIQKFVAELVKFNDTQTRAADANGDGKITIADATEIQKFVAEIIHHLGPKA